MGHLGQLNKICYDWSLHKVLSNYISTSGILFFHDVQCVFRIQTNILDFTHAKISRF